MTDTTKRPAWLSYRIFPLVRLRQNGLGLKYAYDEQATTCPATLLAYVPREEQAYCRACGIPWYPRQLPEVPARGHHPRSADRDLPSVPGVYRPLSDQVRMRFVGGAS